MDVPTENVCNPMVSVVLVLDSLTQEINFCLDSIVYQTLEEMEVLLIGDCSKADVTTVTDYYTALSPKVKACCLPSEWAGHGRQYGLTQAKGEYILFADKNTVMTYSACTKLLEKAQESKCDIVYAPGADIHGPSNKVFMGKVKQTEDGLITREQALRSALYRFPCYLYHKDFLANHQLEADGSFDSLAFTHRIVSYCETLGYVDKHLSFTLINENSLVRQPDNIDNLAFIESARILLAGCHPDAQEIIAWRIASMSVKTAEKQWRFFSEFITFFKEIFPLIQAKYEKEATGIHDAYLQLSDTRYPATIVTTAFGKSLNEDFIQNVKQFTFSGESNLIVLDETNCDLSHNPLIQEAYSKGLYDFVGEYSAMQYIYEHGGVYLSDELQVLNHFGSTQYLKSFFCLESEHRFSSLVFGGSNGSEIFRRILQTYTIRDFYEDPFMPLNERITNVLIAEYDVEMNSNKMLYQNGLMVYDPLTFLTKHDTGINLACLVHKATEDWVSVPNYVLESFYTTSNKDHKNLIRKNNALQAKYKATQGKYKDVQDKYKILQPKYKSLQPKYKSLQTNWKNAIEQTETLRKKNVVLTDKYKSAKTSIEELRSENASLKQQIKTMKNSRIWKLRKPILLLRKLFKRQ